MAEFKPNIYPIMYWAFAFGIAAGLGMYILLLLSQFITIIWGPVFLAGLAWGAYRNYKMQKTAWSKNNGVPVAPQSPLNEFKQAFRDIRDSSQELLAQQAAESQATEAEAQTEAELDADANAEAEYIETSQPVAEESLEPQPIHEAEITPEPDQFNTAPLPPQQPPQPPQPPAQPPSFPHPPQRPPAI